MRGVPRRAALHSVQVPEERRAAEELEAVLVGGRERYGHREEQGRSGGWHVLRPVLREEERRHGLGPLLLFLMYDGNWEAKNAREATSVSTMCVQ